MKICLQLLRLLRTGRRKQSLLEANIIVFPDFVASVRKTASNSEYQIFSVYSERT